ncbi:MAG: MarR family winged helix-turn-helix transcriptional regulator [Flexibacteraceae bacterium]
MKIEEAIKTRKFTTSREKALVNILYTYGWLFNKEKDTFKQFGITPQQYNVLRILKGQYPKSISTCDIKERMLDKNSDASRLVDRMFTHGLVERTVSEFDKRKVDIKISDRGISLLLAIHEQREKLDNIASALSEEDAESLSLLLDKLRSVDEGEGTAPSDCA